MSALPFSANQSPHVITQPSPGQLVDGKYRIEERIGVGGMGAVHLATHVQLKPRVAIKFLHTEALADADAIERFHREAHAAVRLRSEHVARVLDLGTLPGGAPYTVMEYLHGRDLAAILFAHRFAHADASQSAAAQSLFDEGKKLAGQNKFVDACPKFAESQRVSIPAQERCFISATATRSLG